MDRPGGVPGEWDRVAFRGAARQGVRRGSIFGFVAIVAIQRVNNLVVAEIVRGSVGIDHKIDPVKNPQIGFAVHQKIPVVAVQRVTAPDFNLVFVGGGHALHNGRGDIPPQRADFVGTGGSGAGCAGQQRGGKGLKNYNLTAKTGLVAGVAIVEDGEDVMLVENGGVLIRMPVDSINIYKRDTQGVILMRVDEGSRVISIERVDREEEEPETPVEE